MVSTSFKDSDIIYPLFPFLSLPLGGDTVEPARYLMAVMLPTRRTN